MGWFDLISTFIWTFYASESYGYFGVFLISILGNCTIIWPVFPTPIFIFTLGSILNPIAIGIAAGSGSAIGELTGYYLGRSVHKIKEKKNKKWFGRAEKWFHKHGAFFIILIFAATPLPSDVTGVLAGALKYNVKKFLLANFIGKTIMFTIIAIGGYYGMNWILSYFK